MKEVRDECKVCVYCRMNDIGSKAYCERGHDCYNNDEFMFGCGNRARIII